MNELSVAVAFTLIFSVGVGVLFVKTLMEMVELFFNQDVNENKPLELKEKTGH